MTDPWADARMSRFDTFPERSDNSLVETLDVVLLLLAYSRLRFDNGPKFENIILNLLDVGIIRDSVTTCHFFDISLELAHILSHNFQVDNISLWGDFHFRGSWEGH